MNKLAFITFIITSGPYTGEAFVTTQPMECVRDGELIARNFEALGNDVEVHCAYTSAPITSMRPVARPEGLGE